MKTRHRLWQLTVVFIMATLAVVHSAEHPLPFTLKRQGEIVQDEPAKPQTRGDENADAFQYSIADGTVTITGYQGSATNLEIPATINGYPVVAIGDRAFYANYSLTSVTIPEGVTTIGNRAFYDCYILASVTIPEGVTTIGDAAFTNCGLTSVTIPSTVTTIGEYAFSSCDNLTSVTIPSSVTTIGDRAFDSCDSLAAITVDAGNDSYASVDGVLFDKAGTVIVCYPSAKPETSYSIPSGVTAIADGAFLSCSGLTSVTIPNGVTAISNNAFCGCSSLVSVTIPEGVTSIGKYAFIYCTSLASVTIPSTVRSIGNYAFNGCSALAEMEFTGAPPSFDESSYPTPITFHVLPNRGWEKWGRSGVTLTFREITLEFIAIHERTAIDKTNTIYVCTATWDYGPDTNEMPTWSLSSTDYASVDENGKVTNRNTTATDQTVTLNASYTYGGVTKTASKTIVLNGKPQTIQTLELAAGWNWVGFNVLPESRKVGDTLGKAGFTANDIIQTNGDSARFTGTSWTPEGFIIEYGKLYQIYVADDTTVEISGVARYSFPVQLVSGWNWIANSTLEDLAPSQLTHGCGWAENDRIQAAGGNGVAYINGKWIPSGFMLESGKGYQIFTGNMGTLSFPTTDDELYVVVDLSRGPVATTYPVRYSSVGPNLDDDTCRTTELWLRKIPAGTFIMGSPEDEVGRSSRLERLEMVQHEVTLTQDFYIGVFECTQRQWELVMGSNPSEYKGDCRPVETVSYNKIRGTGEQAGAGWPEYGHAVDSTSFMGKLQAKTGLTFDLPTEAQWEYACRAGTTTALNSGKNLTSIDQDAAMDEVGRYFFNTSDGKGGYSEHTTVGSYLPNAWGLYDMHGNVYEWCLDWEPNPYEPCGTTPVVDPVGALSGNFRITRGGAWHSQYFVNAACGAQYCRSASRFDPNPRVGKDYYGFRVLCLP